MGLAIGGRSPLHAGTIESCDSFLGTPADHVRANRAIPDSLRRLFGISHLRFGAGTVYKGCSARARAAGERMSQPNPNLVFRAQRINAGPAEVEFYARMSAPYRKRCAAMRARQPDGRTLFEYTTADLRRLPRERLQAIADSVGTTLEDLLAPGRWRFGRGLAWGRSHRRPKDCFNPAHLRGCFRTVVHSVSVA
jgi:hypothetical protein